MHVHITRQMRRLSHGTSESSTCMLFQRPTQVLHGQCIIVQFAEKVHQPQFCVYCIRAQHAAHTHPQNCPEVVAKEKVIEVEDRQHGQRDKVRQHHRRQHGQHQVAPVDVDMCGAAIRGCHRRHPIHIAKASGQLRGRLATGRGRHRRHRRPRHPLGSNQLGFLVSDVKMGSNKSQGTWMSNCSSSKAIATASHT